MRPESHRKAKSDSQGRPPPASSSSSSRRLPFHGNYRLEALHTRAKPILSAHSISHTVPPMNHPSEPRTITRPFSCALRPDSFRKAAGRSESFRIGQTLAMLHILQPNGNATCREECGVLPRGGEMTACLRFWKTAVPLLDTGDPVLPAAPPSQSRQRHPFSALDRCSNAAASAALEGPGANRRALGLAAAGLRYGRLHVVRPAVCQQRKSALYSTRARRRRPRSISVPTKPHGLSPTLRLPATPEVTPRPCGDQGFREEARRASPPGCLNLPSADLSDLP